MSQFGYVVALDLHHQPVVLVGGGHEAVARLQALLDAGANVTLITPSPSSQLRELVDQTTTADPDRVTHVNRPYREGDLEGARLAICTGEDEASDPLAFWEESRRRHVLASVLDDIPHTDFAQPALVRRGDLRIAISTGGAAPALARRYREDLEAHYGPEHADLLAAASAAREQAGRRPVSFGEWAHRWSTAVQDLHQLAETVRQDGPGAVIDHIVSTLLPGTTSSLHPPREGNGRTDHSTHPTSADDASADEQSATAAAGPVQIGQRT